MLIDRKKIQGILRNYREMTQVLCVSLFTEDGLLIITEQATCNEGEDYHESIGAIGATIIGLATQGIEMLNSERGVKQISIKADENNNEGFEIILKSVTKEVIISIIFTSSMNLGVILFESKKMIHALEEVFLFELENDGVVKVEQNKIV